MPSSKPFTFQGCEKRRHARGLCYTHDWQQRRTGTMWPAGQRYTRGCKFEGCEGKKHHALGYCEGHYTQFRKGEKLAALVRPRRRVRFPADPMREYALERGVFSPVRIDRRWLYMEEVDELCIRVFGVHPWVVYGDQ